MLRHFLLLLMFPLALFAQDQGARIKFDHVKADAGQVIQGEVAEHIFPFINEGTDTLRIANVFSS